MLACAVGFGGSMIWFGSSAGVALSGLFPESRSVGAWLWHRWHVAVAYVLGFFALLWLLGWHPEGARATRAAALPEAQSRVAPSGIVPYERVTGWPTFLPIHTASG